MSMSLFGSNVENQKQLKNFGQMSMMPTSKINQQDSVLLTPGQIRQTNTRNSFTVDKPGKANSLSSSLIEPQHQAFMKDILKEDKKDLFTKLFMDGLEDQTLQSQEQILNREQEILVEGRKHTFNQNDSIFNISESQIGQTFSELSHQNHNDLISQSSNLSKQTTNKKKKVKIVPIQNQPCFCCNQMLSKSVKQDICEFCTKQGCKACVYKKFPFPLKDLNDNQQRGKICKICETKFYVRNKLVEIVKGIEKKDQFSQKLQLQLIGQQTKHNQNETETDQHQITLRENQREYLSSKDKLDYKVNQAESQVERQDKENKRLVQRLNERKQEYEHKLLKIKTLREQIDMLQKGVKSDESELEERQKDREMMWKYLRQVNPNQSKKGQPNQSSFNRKKPQNQNLRNSETNGFQFDENNLETDSIAHMRQNNYAYRESGILTPKINGGIKKKPKNQIKDQKSCCENQCSIF
eukprot:403369568